MAALTATNIRYLMALYELGAAEKGVRCVDLAKRLGISKPSAHGMILSLSQQGLVEKEKYGAVFLSPQGRELGRVYSRHCLELSRSLQPVLKMQDEDCESAACAILSLFPDKLMDMKGEACNDGN